MANKLLTAAEMARQILESIEAHAAQLPTERQRARLRKAAVTSLWNSLSNIGLDGKRR